MCKMACSIKVCKNAWTDAQLKAAKEAVQLGELSIRKAGEKFEIPRSPRSRQGTSTKRYGGAEEKEIATIIMCGDARAWLSSH